MRIKTLIKYSVATVVLIGMILGGVHYLQLHYPIFNFFFQPPGLFKNLASTQLDLGRSGSTYKLPFMTRYPGNHAIDLIVEKPEFQGIYAGKYELAVRIIDDHNNVLLQKKVLPPGSTFWGGQTNSGCSLMPFKIPANIPLRKPLLAEISVIRSDPDFEKKYGQVKLLIRKFSDE
jgi:hypothetical protein